MDFGLLDGTADAVAPRLLGCILERDIDGILVQGRIVEVEAYDQNDVASHSYRGETERTRVMFGPAGYLYVYFTYGMHYCCNIVVGNPGYGAAVLIRAVEPMQGEELMETNRAGRKGHELTNGPAKLCQAFNINMGLNGHDLRQSPLKLHIEEPLDTSEVVQTTRIGLSKGEDVPWRFYVRDNPYVSRP